MRNYYALENTMGNISVFSPYGRPRLHIFESRKERDAFIENFECVNPNHNVRITDSKTAYSAYSYIYDGIRVFHDGVILHHDGKTIVNYNRY